jgi:transposase
MKHYVFRKRLEYKCKIKGIKMRIVNEAYTTKVCDECGYYDNKIKNDRIITCSNCNRTKERDPRSARGITMLGMATK